MTLKQSIVALIIGLCLLGTSVLAKKGGKPGGGGGGGGGGSQVQDPQRLQVTGVSNTAVGFEWRPPKKGADSYLLDYDTQPIADGNASVATIATSNLSYTLRWLPNNTTYHVRVRSVLGTAVSSGVTMQATTLAEPEIPGELIDHRQHPHRIAVSNNGHKMLIWVTNVGEDYRLFYARYDGNDWSDTSELSAPGSYLNSLGDFTSEWKHIDVAAGDGGNFVVGWLDQSPVSGGRVNLLRYINGVGWDAQNNATTYVSSISLGGRNTINVDMSPNGDCAAAVAEPISTSASELWVFYRGLNDLSWERISDDALLTDPAGGDDDQLPHGVPALDMDGFGNVLIVFGTETSGTGDSLWYALYDKEHGWEFGGRQLISSGWEALRGLRVAVDKTRDLTDSVNRGLGGIVWQAGYLGDVFGAVFYRGGPNGDVPASFQQQINVDRPAVSDLTGLDIADGDGHLLVTWTDQDTANEELVQFWFEDADNDGLLDSAAEPLETDGRQVAGWKTTPLIVSDSTILNSPYVDGNSARIPDPGMNLSRVSVGGGMGIGDSQGIIAWSTLTQDAVHVRRILGFDATLQTVVLEGDASTEIPAGNHTLDASLNWVWADELATPYVNYSTGAGVALFHSETTKQLHVVDF